MGFVPLPRLRLDPPPADADWAAPFDGTVLWLGGPDAPPVLADVRQQLGDRVVLATVRGVPVPGPRPGRNPWAARQDRQEPLRWGAGDGLDGPAELAEWLRTRGVAAPLGGVVFAGICASLPDQALRTLLRQLAPLLAPDAPFLLGEPNGRSAVRVSRNLLAPASDRGEGRGTARTVEELRRLLETGGLGLTGAWAAPATRRRDRIARRVLGAEAAAPWMLVTGRALRGGEALR